MIFIYVLINLILIIKNMYNLYKKCNINEIIIVATTVGVNVGLVVILSYSATLCACV